MQMKHLDLVRAVNGRTVAVVAVTGVFSPLLAMLGNDHSDNCQASDLVHTADHSDRFAVGELVGSRMAGICGQVPITGCGAPFRFTLPNQVTESSPWLLNALLPLLILGSPTGERSENREIAVGRTTSVP